MRIYLSSNPESISAVKPHVTIEAEYGDIVVEGSVLTLAHHGSRSDNPCPCVDPKVEDAIFDLKQIELADDNEIIVGLSHWDLDTLGGIMKFSGPFARDMSGPMTVFWQPFWELAAFADVNGLHKVDRDHLAYRRLTAWQAWSTANKVYAPRDGSALEVSKEYAEATSVICHIIGGDHDLLKAGDEFMRQQDALNKSTFMEDFDGVFMRTADQFVNHLYGHPTDGSIAKGVAVLNTEEGSITLSLESPIKGVSCRKIVQHLWGPEAGGHDGIAGSPRDRKMTEPDLARAAAALLHAIESCEKPWGYACRCGCGCTRRHADHTGSYCNACADGCCGE